jgi:hypothetical protein
MPKLPVVSGSEVVRALCAWVLRLPVSAAVTSSCVADLQAVSFPITKKSKSALVGLLKQAGVSPDEFVKALHA